MLAIYKIFFGESTPETALWITLTMTKCICDRRRVVPPTLKALR